MNSIYASVTSITKLVKLLIHSHLLLWEMTKREISDRYAGQILGSLWALIHPVAIIGVFFFLFEVIFRARLGLKAELPYNSTIYMLSGLIPWLVISDVLNRSSTIITSQASLVKQVVFPLEILPAKVVLGSLLPFLVGQFAFFLYAILYYKSFPWVYTLLVPLTVMFISFMMGIAYALASVGVFFRDIKELVQLFVFVGLYLSPIVYNIEWVPENLRFIIYLNPFSYPIICFHDLNCSGYIQHPQAWIVMSVLSLFSLLLGTTLFQKLKTYFGSYL